MENHEIKKNFLSFQIDPKKFEPATDEEKAQQLTQRESVSFFKDAMRRLAALYQYGYGTEQDLGLAREWYEKAAAAGDPYAEYRLSEMDLS